MDAVVKNYIDYWRLLFKDLFTDDQLNQPLGNFAKGESLLDDPTHKVTIFLLKLYSMETFLYSTMNNAVRNEDYTKLHTMGPYCDAMYQILLCAETKRANQLDADTECSTRAKF